MMSLSRNWWRHWWLSWCTWGSAWIYQFHCVRVTRLSNWLIFTYRHSDHHSLTIHGAYNFHQHHGQCLTIVCMAGKGVSYTTRTAVCSTVVSPSPSYPPSYYTLSPISLPGSCETHDPLRHMIPWDTPSSGTCTVLRRVASPVLTVAFSSATDTVIWSSTASQPSLAASFSTSVPQMRTVPAQ